VYWALLGVGCSWAWNSLVQGPEDLTLKKPDTQWCGLVTTKRSFSPSKCSGSTAMQCEMESFRTSEVVSGQNIGTSVWCHWLWN